ncbi:cation:proton antiporter [Luteolibacter pohnpeiensis]|uniref:Cation:proton antiporter n=1 Tax=Luteolibacter pohnpeiensis TaxID=454153 RepID=A0A934S5T2_9BACT|nr:sodium:proton antiporter [Luteolibacter pohnpeiensis]MBK1881699.1 cation:proton antiporter [Luteolibacter pohnpeiensis]
MSPLVFLTMILALGILAQWLAWKFKLPSILLLLGFGFAFGQWSGVRIDDFLAPGDGHSSPLLSVVGLFVAIILFEGGLTLKFQELKESGLPILRLCTFAVVLSFALTTAFMTYALGYNIRIAGLIGCILTVTGPTVIAPLLRHVNPTRKMGSIVKWEGIVVDPIGAILGVLVFKIAIASDFVTARTELLQSIGVMILVGIIGALLIAKGVEFLLKNHLVPDYLQPVFLLAVVAIAFTGSNQIENEAGLLTVTVLGVALANQKSVSVRHILEFKENLRTLIISSLFIILSGRISAADLHASLEKGLILLAFLVLIGRPLSVYLSLWRSKQTTFKERTFLAFLAPRGIVAAAVTSIFALEFEEAAVHGRFGVQLSPLIAEQSRELVALIFLIIIGTVSIYGLAAAPLARRLGLASKTSDGVLFAGADAWARLAAKPLQEDGHRVLLLDTNFKNIATAKMLGLDARRANILSEFAEESIDFNGIGHLVAGTPNDEVNSMAATRFIHQFGRAGVWQIAPADRNEHHTKSIAHELRSRVCFVGGPDHSQLTSYVQSGAVMKKSMITEKFDFDKYRESYPSALILFMKDLKGLRPAPSELTKVAEGTALYALVPPTELPPTA